MSPASSCVLHYSVAIDRPSLAMHLYGDRLECFFGARRGENCL
jgi:hypothetical protein